MSRSIASAETRRAPAFRIIFSIRALAKPAIVGFTFSPVLCERPAYLQKFSRTSDLQFLFFINISFYRLSNARDVG
ncbi:MAG: hypothetical protein ACFFB5_11895 [Promethearchaeota archaeon]